MTKLKRKKATKETIGKVKIVKDFLPTPEKLILKQKPVKKKSV